MSIFIFSRSIFRSRKKKKRKKNSPCENCGVCCKKTDLFLYCCRKHKFFSMHFQQNSFNTRPWSIKCNLTSWQLIDKSLTRFYRPLCWLMGGHSFMPGKCYFREKLFWLYFQILFFSGQYDSRLAALLWIFIFLKQQHFFAKFS